MIQRLGAKTPPENFACGIMLYVRSFGSNTGVCEDKGEVVNQHGG